MTQVVQGPPGEEVVHDHPPIREQPHLTDGSELSHTATVLSKAASFLRGHSEVEHIQIDSIADTDFEVPSNLPKHPENFDLSWITEPGRRHAVTILLTSQAEPYVERRGGSYFLFVRRRT